ncbi:hypothetical protein VTO42DRAFT_1446 [Malbranchea cinnamomea]
MLPPFQVDDCIPGSKSPFSIAPQHEQILNEYPAFRALGGLLAHDPQNAFCETHTVTTTSVEKEIFRLHRDVIHAVLLPLVDMMNQCLSLAKRILPDSPEAELARAFRGEARGAFTWLHSIMTEAGSWCVTRGCPACTVLRALHSEPLIRLLVVACRVSDFLTLAGQEHPEYALPPFGFLLKTVQMAVEQDSFWGPDFWVQIDDQAAKLESGIQQLVVQVHELQRRLGENPTPVLTTHRRAGAIPIRASSVAKRQLAMKRDERAQRLSMLSHQQGIPAWQGNAPDDCGRARRRRRPRIPTIIGPSVTRA